MSGKIVCLLCILFCLGACSDDRFSDSDPAFSPPLGEAIPVTLALDVAPLLSPLSGTTRTGTDGSGLQASFSGMEVELSGTPVVDTRTFPPLDESKIYSVVILQFDGTTSESRCIQIRYIAATAGGVINLDNFSFRATAAPISRIVAIANLSEDYFNLSEWSHTGNKTYQDLLNNYLIKSQDSDDIYPLFKISGTAVNRALMLGMIETKLETGKLITVPLQRIFAKTSFNIEIAEKLKKKYSVWQAQLLNQPGRCYLVSAGRGEPFPSGGTLGDDGYYGSSAVNAVNGVFNPDVLSAYIPVNLQPEVLTATEQTRTLLAPTGGTYLQILGLKMTATGTIEDQVIYQVYLGSNFTTDYTISPNVFYRYTIHVKDDNPQDGTVVKLIPGYWGGELKAYDANGAVVALDSETAVKWRYEKQIEFYPFDLYKVNSDPPTTNVKWGPMESFFLGTSFVDGRQNTWNLQLSPKATYEASYACYKLNSNKISSKEDLVWYQPSIAQLIGTYLAIAGITPTLARGYWSSTDMAGTNDAYYLSKVGVVSYGRKDASYYVRAVKDVEPAN